MKTLTTITAVLLMAGCATPQEFMQSPPDATLQHKLPPEAAALCMTRNLEKLSPALISDRRPGVTGGVELIARISDTIFAIAQLQPAGAGSSSTIWMGTPVFTTKQANVTRMVEGC
jgi:hypothetical protein